jgi:hypothetical protein
LTLFSGCQKTAPDFKRFFLQPLLPQFRIPEHNYGKRYKKQVYPLKLKLALVRKWRMEYLEAMGMDLLLQ